MAQTRLMRLLHFTEADLEHNRQGMLSNAQQNRLRWRYQRGKRTLQATIASTFIGVIFLFFLPTFPIICSAYLAILLAFWFGIYRLLNWDEQRALVEVEDGYVGIIEGLPRRTDERTTRFDPDAGRNHTHIQQYVVIDHVKFAVPRRVQEAFQEYTNYRVYYLPDSYVIVSAEALNTPPALDAIPFDRIDRIW